MKPPANARPRSLELWRRTTLEAQHWLLQIYLAARLNA